MAKHWIVNQTPIHAECMFNLKSCLVSAGWVAIGGGRGTGRGYYADSDPWPDAANLRGAGAWIILESPDGARQIEFVRYATDPDDDYTDRFWSMYYSTKDSGGFINGSPDEDSRATADDEHLIFNGSGGNGWPGSGTYRQHVMADDQAPYGWWTVSYTNGGSAYPTHMAFFDPVVGPIEDSDPVMLFFEAGLGSGHFFSDGAVYTSQCHFKKGMAGEDFVRCSALRISNDMGGFPFGSQGVGSNPHNLKDDLMPFLYGRTTAQVAPYGYKGVSTLFKSCGTSHLIGDALTVNTVRDHLYLGKWMPVVEWNGDIPLV